MHVVAQASSFAQLLTDHAVLPGSRIIQVAIVLLSMFAALGSVGSHHQEHWTQALIRPISLGISGIAVVEVLRLAVSGVLGGTLGF